MTTTPLPQMPEPYQEALTPFWAYTAGQMREYATQARADLEAENKRLRDALQAVVSFWDRLNFDGSSINELHTAARAALEEQP